MPWVSGCELHDCLDRATCEFTCQCEDGQLVVATCDFHRLNIITCPHVAVFGYRSLAGESHPFPVEVRA